MKSRISSGGGAFVLLAAIPLATLSVAACSTTADAVPVNANVGVMCTADQVGEFSGQQATQDVAERIQKATGARTFRWLPKGMMVTMEYRADRVNVVLDATNKIESVRCG
ncbi:MAG: I78 family peptidase inhibitor [Sphingomicrobium sp.]